MRLSLGFPRPRATFATAHEGQRIFRGAKTWLGVCRTAKNFLDVGEEKGELSVQTKNSAPELCLSKFAFVMEVFPRC